MLGFLALAGLLMGGFAVMAVFGAIFLVLRIVFWAVLFPVRLVLKLLWLPFALVGGALSLVAGAAVLGLIVVVVGAIAAALAFLIPLTPFVLLGLMIWAFMKRRPATA